MANKKYIYYILTLILSIFLTSFVSALSLTSQPSFLDVSIIKGANKLIYLNITNPNIFPMYEVEVEGEFVTSGVITKLNINETKQIELVINVDSVGEFTNILKVKGFREVNCSSIGTETKEINITSAGTVPRDLEICVNSNVRFVNTYGNSVRVVIDSIGLDKLLSNNEVYVQLFSTVNPYTYRIEPLIDLGVIRVVDVVQKTHNSLDDGSISLHLISILEKTNLTISTNIVDFNMSYNETITSFMIVKNVGSAKAENVNFYGDWLSFDKQNLNINPGEERAVNFVISPIILSSSDTGKSYIKSIIIKGNNVDEFRGNITIYIKSNIISGGNISSSDWWIRRKQFCDTYPTSPDCLTEPFVIYRDKAVYDCPAILANVSPKDVQSSLQECNNLRGDFTTSSSNMKLDLNSIRDSVMEMVTNNNMLNSTLGESVETIKGFRDTFYFVLGIIFLGIIGYGSGFLMYKYYKRKRSVMMERI